LFRFTDGSDRGLDGARTGRLDHDANVAKADATSTVVNNMPIAAGDVRCKLSCDIVTVVALPDTLQCPVHQTTYRIIGGRVCRRHYPRAAINRSFLDLMQQIDFSLKNELALETVKGSNVNLMSRTGIRNV